MTESERVVDVAARTVTIAIVTYRRPADLARTLPAIAREARSVVDRSAAVLVVDNDPDGGAMEVVRRLDDRLIRYAVEPKPGIAAARNRALELSSHGELLVFIDDDEEPHQGWLQRLLACYDANRPAAVAGAVVSDFPAPLDPWIAAGGFFTRRRLPTGTPVNLVATNNLLVDLRQLRDLGLRFDDRFGLSGGSDTMFSRQLAQRGGRMLWCDDAVVTDHVPIERMSRSWARRRAFRMGNTWGRTSLALSTSRSSTLSHRLALLGQGGTRVVAGTGRAVYGFVTLSLVHRAKGVRTAARGAGMVSSALGHTYREYGRTVEGPRLEDSAAVASSSPDGDADPIPSVRV